ncbi:DEAD/DEAH box helicase [Catenuloplanes sp. NPDC051500]|uniref:DEAD/DEAH box helicase n=1 Tax=Catenuloplanes sp. NPDC051500 TaxID=3363959 RepID=UPI00379AE667
MSWLPYDADLVAQIAAAMDLREPNAAALAAAARAVAPGDGSEAVCELATGVGKSYVSAALVEYLAERGVRNILIVTPGTAVHEKTVGNFTPGHPRYVPGGEWTPAIVTGRARGPAPDPDSLTLYVFTVQQLIRPGASAGRRLHAPDEAWGAGLYQRLVETGDLVVIADEHHVYREAARAFGAAVRELAPRALIGFTATPDRADRARVVFRYPLASAITDGLVAVPVLVGASPTPGPGTPILTGRSPATTGGSPVTPTGGSPATPDGGSPATPDGDTGRERRLHDDRDRFGDDDRERRLRDACRLREAKERAWHGWAAARGVPPMTPLIFVVCRAIDEAEQVADELAGLLPGAGRVLLVTSRSSDEALRALAGVEEQGSPVRAVVAVDKLNSGWDVPNVGVILALRALASETLTEQILGRGLRLPYGRRVGVPAVDSIDVLTHESYRTLLSSTDALRAALAPGSAGVVAPDGDGGVTLTVGGAPLLRISGYERALAAARDPGPSCGEAGEEPEPALGVEGDAAAVTAGPLPATRFSLAAVPDSAARAAGEASAARAAGEASAARAAGEARAALLDSVARAAGAAEPGSAAGTAGPDSTAGTAESDSAARAAVAPLSDSPARMADVGDLAARLLALPLVEATRAESGEAERLAAAYLAGAATRTADGGAHQDTAAVYRTTVAADTAAAEAAADALAEVIADVYRRVRRPGGSP